MDSCGPLHMDEQRQGDQLEHTYSSSVPIRDVAPRIYRKQWTIEMCGERGSGISVLIERREDDRGAFNKFPDFFVQAFTIVVDYWKFSMLLLYILWDDWPISMISGSNEQLQQEFEYTLLKPDCHCWWISKMQSGREDTLGERYAIKFCFQLEKRPQKRMECFRLLLEHLAWIEHQFLSGIRDSRKAGSLWGTMRGVGGVRKSIHQSWLAKRLGLLCWGFKGVQEEIPSQEASTLQIGSVAFPSGQCTSSQLHPCHRLFDQDGLKTVRLPPYSPDLAPCDFCLFPKLRGCRYETIEEVKEAVMKVIDTLTQ